MATIKILLRDAVRKDGTHPISIRITTSGRVNYHTTGYAVLPTQFKDGKVIRHPDAVLMNTAIEVQRSRIMEGILLADIHGEAQATETLREAIKARLQAHEKRGHVGAFGKLNAVAKVIPPAVMDTAINKITKKQVDEFIEGRGVGAATLKKDLSILASITGSATFKAAARQVRSQPVNRDKLSREEIGRIESAALEGKMSVYRDMFLFSYYAHGMRFENVATFTRRMVQGDFLRYRMNKGEAIREVEILPPLRIIIDRYWGSGGPYLFPVISQVVRDRWAAKRAIGSANASANRCLKKIAKICGIDKKLHFHITRHSFARLLHEGGVSVELIQKALGHTSYNTTRVYLRSLSDEAVNDAVRGVLG